MSWNKLDASDLTADLSVVKSEVSKVSKALQLSYTWAGKFSWYTYCYQSLVYLFFLECSLFKGRAGIVCRIIGAFTRHYGCSLKPLPQLCWWLEMPKKLPSIHKQTHTNSNSSILVQVEVMKHFTTIFFSQETKIYFGYIKHLFLFKHLLL